MKISRKKTEYILYIKLCDERGMEVGFKKEIFKRMDKSKMIENGNAEISHQIKWIERN